MNYYEEPSRCIPINGSYDVIVAGGGTSGLFAAIAAARNGARTLVVERLNCLGGLMTAGMMSAACGINDMEKIVVRGIPLEFFQRIRQYGGMIDTQLEREAFIFFDAEVGKRVATEMIAEEPNLDVLYYSVVSGVMKEGSTVKGLIIENKSGRQLYLGKVIIDATGDADVAFLSGAETVTADPKHTHPVSLLAKIGGINGSAVKQYYKDNPSFLGTFTRNWPVTPFHTYRLDKELEGKSLPDNLEYLRDWFVLFYETVHDGEFIINMSGETMVDGTDVAAVSNAEIASRLRLEDCMEVLRRFIPGCEKCYLISTGSTIGIRESRQLIGRYEISLDDLLEQRPFDDTISRACALVGNHTSDGKDSKFEDIVPGHPFYMPYRCMLPVNIEGLIVTGRCISVTPEAMGGTRIMPVCMGLGQAAGTAAAICAKHGVSPAEINIKELQATLIEDGAYL